MKKIFFMVAVVLVAFTTQAQQEPMPVLELGGRIAGAKETYFSTMVGVNFSLESKRWNFGRYYVGIDIMPNLQNEPKHRMGARFGYLLPIGKAMSNPVGYQDETKELTTIMFFGQIYHQFGQADLPKGDANASKVIYGGGIKIVLPFNQEGHWHRAYVSGEAMYNIPPKLDKVVDDKYPPKITLQKNFMIGLTFGVYLGMF